MFLKVPTKNLPDKVLCVGIYNKDLKIMLHKEGAR
jgi:hypothetical protein